MKAIKLTADSRTVTEVDIPNTIEALWEHVGGYIELALRFPNGDVLYVDEEGLIKGGPKTFQVWEDEQRIFAGNGVIVGSDDEGERQPCKSTVSEIAKKGYFTDIAGARLIAKSWGI